MVLAAVRVCAPILVLAMILCRPLDLEAELGLPQMRLGEAIGVSVGYRLPVTAWDRALHDIERDEARIAICLRDPGCPDAPARAIAERLRRLGSLSARHQVEAVNALINEVPYAEDDQGRDDWQAPISFLSGTGDCEDYAIAKYVALRVLGYEEEALRLVVVEDVRRALPHALLMVDGPDELWLLDNLRDSVETRLSSSYRPLYAVNRSDRWVFAAAH